MNSHYCINVIPSLHSELIAMVQVCWSVDRQACRYSSQPSTVWKPIQDVVRMLYRSMDEASANDKYGKSKLTKFCLYEPASTIRYNDYLRQLQRNLTTWAHIIWGTNSQRQGHQWRENKVKKVDWLYDCFTAHQHKYSAINVYWSMLSVESSLSNTVDDGDDDDLSGFLLGLATSRATLGGSWVFDLHHWWYSPSM